MGFLGYLFEGAGVRGYGGTRILSAFLFCEGYISRTPVPSYPRTLEITSSLGVAGALADVDMRVARHLGIVTAAIDVPANVNTLDRLCAKRSALRGRDIDRRLRGDVDRRAAVHLGFVAAAEDGADGTNGIGGMRGQGDCRAISVLDGGTSIFLGLIGCLLALHLVDVHRRVARHLGR